MKKIRVLALIMTVCAAIALYSCGAAVETEKPDGEYDDAFRFNTFAGVVTSAGETKIEKDPMFEVATVNVSVGDVVKEGDVLFVYDTKKANLDLERAKLDLEQLENNLENLEEAKNRLELEKASAPADMQLQYSLEIQEKETEIIECDYNIKSKKKDIENLESTMINTDVKSPVSGTVSSINNSSEGYGAESGFIVIKETGNLKVKGYVNENNINDVVLGMSVTVKSRIDESVWSGTVTEIDTEKPEEDDGGGYYFGWNGADVSTSSRYPFYVELDDSEGLMIGQHVYITTESAGA